MTRTPLFAVSSVYSARRDFIRRFAFATALFATPGAFAQRLIRTPSQTEGPFYPDHLPLDTDNDLLIVNDSITPAIGEVTWLTGRVLDSRGAPVRNATVEIWQCDRNGVYFHSQGGSREKMDRNFQGFGRFVTGSTGEYLFRTIKPVPYPGRTPHIHFALKIQGQPKFTTQCYIRGESLNLTDGVLKGMSEGKEKSSLMVPFVPMRGSKLGELAARFDLVTGITPRA